MNKKKINERGIALTTFIIIMILLLIVVGVTIVIVLKQTEKSHIAQETERKNSLDKNEENINKTDNKKNDETGQNQSSNEWSEVYKTTQKDNYTDKNGKKATIPAGFQVSLKNGETEIENGLVIRNATDKNEFVWVPVDDIKDYKRTEFSSGVTISSEQSNGKKNQYYCIESMPEEEKTSVEKYKGYYIGRYEAGMESTQARTKKNNSATIDQVQKESGKVLSQKGKIVYNYLTRDQAKGLSEDLYKESKNNVISKLCSSYAWDTALTFISKNNPTYLTNSIQGNYRNASFQYSDIDGSIKLKESGSAILLLTGQTTSLNNIYDLGGNVWEFTTESYNWEKYPIVARGGDYLKLSDMYCAPARITGELMSGGSDYSFRVTLYVQ